MTSVLSHEFDHFDGILHRDRAKKLMTNIPLEDRNKVRTESPYTIISKTGEFKYPPLVRK